MNPFKLIHSLVNDLESLFRYLSMEIPKVEKGISSVDDFKNTLQDIENSMISILPMYNYYSYVIMTTRHILGPMLMSAHKELFENENLQKFLGIERMEFVPSDKVRALYFHKESGIANMLFKLLWYSFVPKEQVINDFKVFVNRFLQSINLTIENARGEKEYFLTRCKIVDIASNLSASVRICRYPADRYRFILYERGFNISELFEDKTVNYILFLDPSFIIRVDNYNDRFHLEALESLWERVIEWGSEISPSKLLGDNPR